MSTTPDGYLRALYDRHSKHSSYQRIHPMLLPLLGDVSGLPAGKLEAQRQRFFERAVPMSNRTVLDIGANTGYFSFAALQAGALRVRSQEGNAAHASFLEAAASALNVADRLQVVASYFDFEAEPDERFDVALCLNVVHHLGADFGDNMLTISQAREQMLSAINAMTRWSRRLVFQMGFNWKGDRHQPLFEGGQKACLIDWVLSGTVSHWRTDEIVVADPQLEGEFKPVEARNLPRNDAVGEFMNRPLFVMTARDSL